jgi:acyl carrier protein
MTKEINYEWMKELIFEITPSIRGRAIAADGNLFDLGALDSYSMMVMVQRFEDRLGIIFDYSDMRPYFFRNIDALLQLLIRKYDCVLSR